MLAPRYLIIAALFAGCGLPTKRSVTAINITSKKAHTKIGAKDQLPSRRSLKERILGVWTDGSDVNASFMIQKDSILYIEDPHKHRYDIIGDSIKIKFDDAIYSYRIYFERDSLVMVSRENDVHKLWRFKD